MVVKGFTQIYDKYYKSTYTSVARLESIWIIATILAIQQQKIWQVDFVVVYLNSKNRFETYIKQLPGFEKGKNMI